VGEKNTRGVGKKKKAFTKELLKEKRENRLGDHGKKDTYIDKRRKRNRKFFSMCGGGGETKFNWVPKRRGSARSIGGGGGIPIVKLCLEKRR